jgi:GntR family negative regulator for fad regulon and positive regulator of fabA
MDALIKPADFAEQQIITSILGKRFPINSSLPPERELAQLMGVTRPTLREALQRLSRDGWVEIHQGKSTRVRDFWKEGNLNVLSTLTDYQEYLPEDFVFSLLQIRLLLCPTYTFLAIQNDAEAIAALLKTSPNFTHSATRFSEFDFLLHVSLAQSSGNPAFTLILNGFHRLILEKSNIYFENEEARKFSLFFYQTLLESANEHDPEKAKQITQKVMAESIQYWMISAKKKEE